MKRKILHPLAILTAVCICRYVVKGSVWFLNNYILNPKISIDLFTEGLIFGVAGLLVFAWTDSLLSQKR